MAENDTDGRVNEQNRNVSASKLTFVLNHFRFPNRSTAVRIFLVTWLVFALHFATNTVREIYPALSLGDHFSFDVSEYAGLHPDIFEIPGRGTFINNNPGASVMGAIPYLIFRPVTDRVTQRVQASRAENPQPDQIKYDTIYPMAQDFLQNARERGFDVKFGLAAGITQAFVMAPVSALGAVIMFWILLAITDNKKASLWLALLYAFATPVLFRTAQLNQNMLVANFALFAFAMLWRPWDKDDSQNKSNYFLAGLCCGWTVVLDYSGIVAVLAISGYALVKWIDAPRSTRDFSGPIRYVAGLAACGVILMAYQWIAFGNPILPAQSYMPPANFTELGYRGFSFPQLDLLFDTALDKRFGLFVSAPVLILAFAVPIWLRKSTRLLNKREIAFVCGFTLLFFLFCAANQYGRMQFNTGVRHIVPVVPFVFLLAANVLLRMPRLVAVIFGVLATYWSFCLAMYRDVEQGMGVLESIRHISLEGFRLPWLTTLEKMGFVDGASAVPLLCLAGMLIWALFAVGRKQAPQEIQ